MHRVTVPWRHRRSVALAAAGVVFVSCLTFYESTAPPLTGDEPHYVVYAQSIGRGWGLDLRRAYEGENRRTFYDGEIEPHARFFAGPDGRFAGWHGIALPLILAPLAAWDPPVRIYQWAMIAIAALVAYHLFRLAAQMTGAPAIVVAIGVISVMVSPPSIYHSGQVYPELCAALLLVLAFRSFVSSRSLSARLSGACVAAGALPWFNVRDVTLTFGLVLFALAYTALHTSPGPWRVRIWSFVSSLVLPMLLTASLGSALIAFNIELFGAPVAKGDFSSFFQLSHLYLYGVGGLLGFPSGLLPLGPVLIMAAVAIPAAAKGLGTRPTLGVAAIALLYLGFNTYLGTSGWSVPGRYQISVVPLLALPLVTMLARARQAAWFGFAVMLALTLVSAVTSARYFAQLYTSDRAGIQPLGMMQRLWPMATDEVLPSSLSAEAREMAHQVGVLEELEGSEWLVARQGRDPLGVLAFGPYIRLQDGVYEAVFELYVEPDGGTARRARVEVVDSYGTFIQQVNVPNPVSVPQSLVQTVAFRATTGAPSALRVIYMGEGVLGIRRYSVRQTAPLPLRQVNDERWKALAWVIGLGVLGYGWRRSHLGHEQSTAAAL